jgi:hypothetical protein
MSSTVAISILISLAINEFLGLTDWLAYRITRWTAARWKARTGFDHLEEMLEDLDHAPGRLFKVISSSWLLLGTYINVEYLTLNLPSLWRRSSPFRSALSETFQAIAGLLGSLQNRIVARVAPAVGPKLHTMIVKSAVSLLPKREQPRYSEEWLAELYEVSPQERTRWVIQLVLSAPQLAVWMRLQSAQS